MTTKVASIYFMPCRLERPLYGGLFTIPAVPKSTQPAILEVRDHTQWEKQPHILGGQKKPTTICGEQVAHDIVQHWTMGALGQTVDCGRGIWKVRKTLPDLNPNG